MCFNSCDAGLRHKKPSHKKLRSWLLFIVNVFSEPTILEAGGSGCCSNWSGRSVSRWVPDWCWRIAIKDSCYFFLPVYCSGFSQNFLPCRQPQPAARCSCSKTSTHPPHRAPFVSCSSVTKWCKWIFFSQIRIISPEYTEFPLARRAGIWSTFLWKSDEVTWAVEEGAA